MVLFALCLQEKVRAVYLRRRQIANMRARGQQARQARTSITNDGRLSVDEGLSVNSPQLLPPLTKHERGAWCWFGSCASLSKALKGKTEDPIPTDDFACGWLAVVAVCLWMMGVMGVNRF